MELSRARLAKTTWAVLAYTLLVILFGAFVRATGSGAGCGAHWPLCNGEIIPRPQQIETVIEFTHRVTSGLTVPMILLIFIWTWRRYPKGSLIRISSAGAFFFIITESLIGAGLVLFELVAHNASIGRAFWMMAHLINTFILMAMLITTAWWATTGVPERLNFRGLRGGLLFGGIAAMLLLGASGAVTALGDTLFPAESLAHGLAQDFSPTAHWLERMRIYHPAIAISVGIYLYLATAVVRRNTQAARAETFTNALFVLYLAQIVIGVVNVALLAPVWIQIVHLLVSNLIWGVFILLAVVVFSDFAPRLSHQPIHKPVQSFTGE